MPTTQFQKSLQLRRYLDTGNVQGLSDLLSTSGSGVTLTGVETLTNKTLTSPAISTPSGLVKGDVGLGNVDNTSDATKNAASVTLTNKTLTTPTIGSLVNATHDHTNAAGGGQLTSAALSDAAQITANTQTASYQVVLTDAGKCVEMNVAGANTLTIPPNSTVAFPIGTVIEAYQMGAGQTTVTAGGGVTFRSPHGAKTAIQYATVTVRKRATDEWVVSGDTTT